MSKKEPNYQTFSLRLSEDDNERIEKTRTVQNQKRPIGYKELDKTGAIRVLMQFGWEAFKAANGIDTKTRKKS